MFGFKRRLVELEISPLAFDEIAGKLGVFIVSHSLDSGALDLRDIVLTRGPDPVLPKHRPISKNTAPGAI